CDIPPSRCFIFLPLLLHLLHRSLLLLFCFSAILATLTCSISTTPPRSPKPGKHFSPLKRRPSSTAHRTPGRTAGPSLVLDHHHRPLVTVTVTITSPHVPSRSLPDPEQKTRRCRLKAP